MRNTGLIVDNKIVDWIFLGSDTKLDNVIIRDDSNWTMYKTVNEKQFNDIFDTWNCVAFSADNAVEVYAKYMLTEHKISTRNLLWLQEKGYIANGEVNFSDRFTGAMAGTKVGVGNSASVVANSIHNVGLVPESLYPFGPNMSPDEYYQEPPEEIKQLGLEFLKRFNIAFEAVNMVDIDEALKYAPIQVFVNAWYKDKNGLYYNPSNKVNHATLRLRSTTKQIFDHYDPFIKSLVTSYKYSPYGFKFTLEEKIDMMNIEDFVKINDLLFVRNEKTGQFGRIMQGKLKVVETTDRGTLMLLDDAVRRNGRGLTEDEWEILPKEIF